MKLYWLQTAAGNIVAIEASAPTVTILEARLGLRLRPTTPNQIARAHRARRTR